MNDVPLFAHKGSFLWQGNILSWSPSCLPTRDTFLSMTSGGGGGGGGGTWAFRHGVSIQDIQAQGTWSSHCGVTLPPSATSTVSSAMATTQSLDNES